MTRYCKVVRMSKHHVITTLTSRRQPIPTSLKRRIISVVRTSKLGSYNFVRPISPAPSNPHWPMWKGRRKKPSIQSTTKPWPLVPSGTETVHDQEGLRAGGANNLWVKMSRRKRVSRLKAATYNVRTLLRDGHIQKLEELRDSRLVWDVIKTTTTVLP